MIEFEQSSLFNEVEKITKNVKKVSFYWTAEIHVNGKSYDPLKLLNLDIVRNYQSKFADESTVSLLIPLGLWVKVIYPNRTTVEISLYKKPLMETSGSEDQNKPTLMERYSANPVLEGLPVFTGTDIDRLSQETLDLRDILTINFQLFNKNVEKLRLVTIGGLYRNCNNEDVIKTVLSNEAAKIETSNGVAIDALDVVPISNKTVRNHVIIDQGVRLVDLPIYLQDKQGGVYNTDINSYIQSKTWYVYPLYDTTRLANSKRTLTIIKVPQTKLRSIERTYLQEGDNLTILATSESSFEDDCGTNFLNFGNGTRFSSSDAYLNNIIDTKDNKALIKRSNFNSEFVSSDVSQRNNVQFSKRRIHSNPFVEYSKLAKITGGTYDFAWENADPELLYPGMMVKVLYLNNTGVDEFDGVLLFNHISVQLVGAAATAKKHVLNCALSIFVNNTPKLAQSTLG